MIYPYECECGHKADIDMLITDEHPMTMECPECKQLTLKRVWMKTHVMYSDDFKEENRIHYDRPHPGRHQFY